LRRAAGRPRRRRYARRAPRARRCGETGRSDRPASRSFSPLDLGVLGEPERALDGALRLRPDRRGGRLAVLEEDDRRNRDDPVLLRERRLLVDVDLHEAELLAALVGDLVEDGRDGVAGTAPLGPEVDDHRLVALENFLVEAGFG